MESTQFEHLTSMLEFTFECPEKLLKPKSALNDNINCKTWGINLANFSHKKPDQ